ncbi:MAG TPA: hypothetical protein VLD39_17510 [Gammaproteobacteria bacterium]|nr:hypothetical protein [Gammaproteobacteria bacterium]
MNAFVAQLKRELWEHPVLYVAPAAIGGVLLVASAMLLMAGGSGDLIQVVMQGIDVADAQVTGVGITVALMSLLPAFLLPMLVVVSFYLLDCLIGERRDRSILFFKSLPVSDVTTVLSKLATALLVAPGVAVVALMATQLGVLMLASIALAVGDGGIAPLWSPSRLLSVWVFAGYTTLAFGLWHAPIFGFLLAVSAWARRAPLLWASSPLALMIVEVVLTGRSRLAALLGDYLNGFWAAAYLHEFGVAIGEEQANELLRESQIEASAGIGDWIDPLGLLTSPLLWLGLLAAACFVTGAVYVRRFRDDS